MACLECDAPGHYTDTGLCAKCNKECLGIEAPKHSQRPGVCYDCGRLVDANEDYCCYCQDELDSYYDYFDPEDD